MHIQVCHLRLHENLFYATREIGRLYETGRYLHNYGLTYALGLVDSTYFSPNAIPRYQSELLPLNELSVYVTPARPNRVYFELNTFKYADNNYRVKMTPSSRNTPSYGRAKELGVGSTFDFVVLSREEWILPKWIRLGKWMSKAEITVAASETVNEVRSGEFVSDFPLNPLDLLPSHQVHAFDLISMPPVSLLDNALISGPHYRLDDGRSVPAELAYRFPGQDN